MRGSAETENCKSGLSSLRILPTKFPVNWHNSIQKRFKIDFLVGYGSHLGFPIRILLAFF